MKVSIIVPIYNVEPYIRECLDSVASQTLSDGVECILVDDCGIDNSVRIAEEFITRYVGNIKFVILHHKKNSGLSAARNTGIKASKGEYLFFLDSDDCLMPDCLEQMLQCANNADMVQGTYESDRLMLSSFSKSLPAYTEDKALIKSMMLNYDIFPVMAQNRLVKRSLIVDNNLYFKEGIIHEDCYWTFFLAKHVQTLSVCTKPTYYYRENPNGITGKINREKEIKAFHAIVSDFSANIDPFLPGHQKVLILNYLITLINNMYYSCEEERDEIIQNFSKTNSNFERSFLNLYLVTRNVKILHLLIRLYKFGNFIKTRFQQKLWLAINPRIREHIILPYLRHKMKGSELTLLCNNCNGACILHDCGLKFNSPFVNLWLYPKDYVKYCSNIEHYRKQDLLFVTNEDIPGDYHKTNKYPVGKLDDIYIYFEHYKTKEDAASKWIDRTKRMNLSNIHAILVERDGCTKQDMIKFDKLPIKKAILTKQIDSKIKSACYIPGFDDKEQLGQLMEIMPHQYLGKKYYDYFDYIHFLNS